MNESAFNYQMSLQDNIICIEFWGQYAEQSMVETKIAVLQFAAQTKTKNVLYDVSRLQGSISNLQKNIFYLHKIVNSNALEKLAVFAPNYCQNGVNKLIQCLINSRKEKVFSNKEKAVDWLKS